MKEEETEVFWNYLGEGQMDDGEWERERMKDINKTSPVRRVWRD